MASGLWSFRGARERAIEDEDERRGIDTIRALQSCTDKPATIVTVDSAGIADSYEEEDDGDFVAALLRRHVPSSSAAHYSHEWPSDSDGSDDAAPDFAELTEAEMRALEPVLSGIRAELFDSASATDDNARFATVDALMAHHKEAAPEASSHRRQASRFADPMSTEDASPAAATAPPEFVRYAQEKIDVTTALDATIAAAAASINPLGHHRGSVSVRTGAATGRPPLAPRPRAASVSATVKVPPQPQPATERTKVPAAEPRVVTRATLRAAPKQREPPMISNASAVEMQRRIDAEKQTIRRQLRVIATERAAGHSTAAAKSKLRVTPTVAEVLLAVPETAPLPVPTPKVQSVVSKRASSAAAAPKARQPQPAVPDRRSVVPLAAAKQPPPQKAAAKAPMPPLVVVGRSDRPEVHHLAAPLSSAQLTPPPVPRTPSPAAAAFGQTEIDRSGGSSDRSEISSTYTPSGGEPSPEQLHDESSGKSDSKVHTMSVTATLQRADDEAAATPVAKELNFFAATGALTAATTPTATHAPQQPRSAAPIAASDAAIAESIEERARRRKEARVALQAEYDRRAHEKLLEEAARIAAEEAQAIDEKKRHAEAVRRLHQQEREKREREDRARAAAAARWQVAINVHNSLTMKYHGWLPWKRLVAMSNDRHDLAKAHDETVRKRHVFAALKANVVLQRKVHAASSVARSIAIVRFAHFAFKRACFMKWRAHVHDCRRDVAVACVYRVKFLFRRMVNAAKRRVDRRAAVVCRKISQLEQLADLQLQRRAKLTPLRAWLKRSINAAEERERSEYRQRLLAKANEVLQRCNQGSHD